MDSVMTISPTTAIRLSSFDKLTLIKLCLEALWVDLAPESLIFGAAAGKENVFSGTVLMASSSGAFSSAVSGRFTSVS